MNGKDYTMWDVRFMCGIPSFHLVFFCTLVFLAPSSFFTSSVPLPVLSLSFWPPYSFSPILCTLLLLCPPLSLTWLYTSLALLTASSLLSHSFLVAAVPTTCLSVLPLLLPTWLIWWRVSCPPCHLCPFPHYLWYSADTPRSSAFQTFLLVLTITGKQPSKWWSQTGLGDLRLFLCRINFLKGC